MTERKAENGKGADSAQESDPEGRTTAPGAGCERAEKVSPGFGFVFTGGFSCVAVGLPCRSLCEKLQAFPARNRPFTRLVSQRPDTYERLRAISPREASLSYVRPLLSWGIPLSLNDRRFRKDLRQRSCTLLVETFLRDVRSCARRPQSKCDEPHKIMAERVWQNCQWTFHNAGRRSHEQVD